ncbi:ATP-dependent Clp protease ATP-binding subunit [Senna tora]|uniref:ATP-dependent Clp protease ATP-binding subunit n=1 Tax=Senna tora TaxID=362788 RepID=A0A834U4K8_9FABA|nr:ATP-dependent Clp protease ATP-binding subunit [Senna tora]
MAILRTLATPLMIVMTAVVTVNAGDANGAYSPCLDSRVDRSDGFSFGIPFASKDKFFYNNTVQFSPSDNTLYFTSSNPQISMLRSKLISSSLSQFKFAKMLEGFTESANKVIMCAQQEAFLLGHKYISQEHILMALISQAGGLAAKSLQSAKIDLNVIREQIEMLFGRGGGCSGSFCMDLRFTHGAKCVLEFSREEAHRIGHAYIETRDLLLGLLKGCDTEIARLLQNQGASVTRHMAVENEEVLSLNDVRGKDYSKNNQKLTPSVSENTKDNQKLTPSVSEITKDNQNLTLSVPQNTKESQKQTLSVPQNTKDNQRLTLSVPQNTMDNDQKLTLGVSQNKDFDDKKGGKNRQTPTLDTFGTNLTKLAKEGKLHPFVGRQDEVERVIQIFCRRMKNNPCLVGEPGVGKTAIIEGLAQRIINGSVPAKLRGKKEIEESGDVILFIKQVHTFFETTTVGARNSSYALKHALDGGVIQCISSTTVNEHRKHIENDAALKRIFQLVDVTEPSIEETIKILKGLRGMYGTHHKVRYTDEALEAAAKLSQQYICGRFLPDKAIDLIDEAGSHVQHFPTQEKRKCSKSNSTSIPEVTKSDIQHIVSSWTGIPVSDVSKEEGERLLKLEEKLQSHVIGQTEAINSISRAIRRARLGLGNTRKPIASFMFTGATGVGKTELAKALATNYFGSEDALVRLDMSEYTERHTASRLIGAPPGYAGFDEGGQLTEAVRHRPHALVLFDEIEKAHSDVFNLMLQILDDGRLTDGKGNTVDFNNTLIIMTSNIGNNIMIDSNSTTAGNEELVSGVCMEKLVMKELKKHFKPEFLNRFDEIIVFKQLTKQDVKKIADLMLREVGERLKGKDMQLLVTCKFRDHVVENGYNPCYGARPLRRTISRLLEDALAEKMLKKEIKEGDSVVVDVGLEGNVVVVNQKNNATKGRVSATNYLDLSKKRGKETGIACNLMAKMFHILSFKVKKKEKVSMEHHMVQNPLNVTEKPLSNCKINIPDLDLHDSKKDDSNYLVSPYPRSPSTTRSSTVKWNCLCSPTTHAGSFRCRHHRASGIMRGRSVGSGLSELASKSSRGINHP